MEFCNNKAYNHQEIPRLNARARRAVRDGRAYLKRSTFSTRIVYREHIVLRTMYVRTDNHSLRTQIQYANRFLSQASVGPVSLTPFFLLGSAVLCPTGSLSCARNAVQCDVENQSPKLTSCQVCR